MNVYRGLSGQLWFEVSRTERAIKLHNELRTGYEPEPQWLTLVEFSKLGMVLVHEGEEGLAIARERLGNVLLGETHPLENRSRSPWDR